jgi:TonB family protein
LAVQPRLLLCVARYLVLALTLAVDADSVGPRIGPRAANAAETGSAAVSSEHQHGFDISAQPLASALEIYGVVTGLQIVYDGNLATNRKSSDVKGAFTPERALERLLEGTGLAPRYMAPDAVMLVPRATDDAVNTASSLAVARYYGRVQTQLKRAFCANSRTQPGGYRIAISFWIGPSGAVARAELLGSTGGRELDAAISQTISGLTIDPPPPGFAQPVTLVVEPQMPGSPRECQAIRADAQSKDAR